MKGYRKFILGLVYMSGCFLLGTHALASGVRDFTGLGIFATGIATGVAAVVWGNVQNAKPPSSPVP